MAKLTAQQMLAMAAQLETGGPSAPAAAPIPDLQSDIFGAGSMPVSNAPAPAQQFDHSAAVGGLPGTPYMTPEQMHASFHAANGGRGHEEVRAAQVPQGGPDAPLAPPLPGVAQPNVPRGSMDESASQGGQPSLEQLARGMIGRGQHGEALGQGGLLTALGQEKSGIDDEVTAARQKADLQGAEGQAMEPVEAQKSQIAAQNEARNQAIIAQGEKAASDQMVRLNAAADEAAQAEVHNFWADKSTGARILGVLAQAFAGAANGLSNNPGAMTPLDRIIQADMQRQTVNMQQKDRVVDQQRGLLRDIQQSTGSQLQSQAAMYIASWKRVEQTAAELKNKFATPEAEQGFTAAQALAQQRIAQATEKVYGQMRDSAIQEQTAGMGFLNEDAKNKAAAGHTGSGENEKLLVLAGTKGAVDNRTYDKFKESDQAYRAIIGQQESIKTILQDVQTGKLTEAEGFKRYKSARSALLADMRKAQGTGAALSDQEFKNLEANMPDYVDARLPGWRSFVAGEGNAMMDRLMATSSRAYFSKIDHTVKGVELDPNDPVYGKHVQAYVAERADQLSRSSAP